MCSPLFEKLRYVPLVAAALLTVAASSCDSNGPAAQSPFPVTSAGNKTGSPAAGETDEVKVTVTGAVLKPGVYHLSRQSNVAQAILEAGGLTDRAVLDTLDLKELLRDDMRIVVPTMPGSVPVASTPPPSSLPEPPPASPLPTTEVTPPPAALMVVVKGAVAKPGAYQLAPGSVVATAIVAAGGLASNANIGPLNLQQPLRQGMTVTVPASKIVIASETPAPPAPSVKSIEPSREDTATSAPQSPLNINRATAAQLQNLPGIGPSLATRIVAYRKEVGAFRTPEQLMDVKGITPEKFSQIQSLVSTD